MWQNVPNLAVIALVAVAAELHVTRTVPVPARPADLETVNVGSIGYYLTDSGPSAHRETALRTLPFVRHDFGSGFVPSPTGVEVVVVSDELALPPLFV